MDSVLCSFVARFVPFSKDSHLDDTALLRSLALPLSRSLALPLSRALALSLSRSFALSLSRSPALSLSHSINLSLSLASVDCVFPELCRVAAPQLRAYPVRSNSRSLARNAAKNPSDEEDQQEEEAQEQREEHLLGCHLPLVDREEQLVSQRGHLSGSLARMACQASTTTGCECERVGHLSSGLKQVGQGGVVQSSCAAAAR